MSHPRIEDARAYCERIRELILHHGGGWADTEALEKFRALSFAASRAADDAQCSQLMSVAERCALDLFSGSAHERWATGRTSGADFLRLRILRALDAFRDRLASLQPLGRGLGVLDADRKPRR